MNNHALAKKIYEEHKLSKKEMEELIRQKKALKRQQKVASWFKNVK
jgi:hypothetical protein